MIFFDILLYALIAWYLDNIFAEGCGAQPLSFVFKASYWRGVFGIEDTSSLYTPPLHVAGEHAGK